MQGRGLDAFEPDDRCWTYGRIRLRVFGHSDGTIDATWAFGQDTSVISERTHQDEGNAYARLGEVLARLERKEEARAAYERGTSQAGRFGHSVMADDLGLALIGLNE